MGANHRPTEKGRSASEGKGTGKGRRGERGWRLSFQAGQSHAETLLCARKNNNTTLTLSFPIGRHFTQTLTSSIHFILSPFLASQRADLFLFFLGSRLSTTAFHRVIDSQLLGAVSKDCEIAVRNHDQEGRLHSSLI